VTAAPVLASLADIQCWFQTVITDPASIEAGAARAGSPIASVVDVATAVGADEGLGVYHHAYRSRLVECLADDFPALRYAVGEGAFDELASRYITRHPSRSTSLNGYGGLFESFLRDQAPGLPSFLGDLAALEWSLVEILHAEDAPPLPVDALAKVSPERWTEARFIPSPTLRLRQFDFPVNDFFQAFKDGLSPREPRPALQHLAVYRQGFTLWRMVLRPSMATLLRSFARGVPLGEALSEVERVSTEPLAAADVMAWFSSWVQGGFFQSIELPGAAP